MAHLRFILQVKKVGIDLVFAEGGEAHGCYEFLARGRHHAADGRALLTQQADQLTRLVRCDAAADDQEDAFAVQNQNPVRSMSSAFMMVECCDVKFPTGGARRAIGIAKINCVLIT